MKAKRLMALLLCLLTVIGIIPPVLRWQPETPSPSNPRPTARLITCSIIQTALGKTSTPQGIGLNRQERSCTA